VVARESRGWRWASEAQASLRVLLALRELAPVVLRDLAGVTPDPVLLASWMTDTLDPALARWGARHRLASRPLLLYAGGLLMLWSGCPAAVAALRGAGDERLGEILGTLPFFEPLDLGAAGGPLPDGLPRVFAPPTIEWSPDLSRERFRRHAHAVLRAALVAFLDDAEAAIRDAGILHATDTRDEHARWLVRYQVLGESFTDIARSLPGHRDPRRARQTVHNGVDAVAERLRLELRAPARGGNPWDL